LRGPDGGDDISTAILARASMPISRRSTCARSQSGRNSRRSS
jgi:hypothetical protein